MSTLQVSASFAPRSSAELPRRSNPLLRLFSAMVAAVAETNRRRAEREIARIVRSYRLSTQA